MFHKLAVDAVRSGKGAPVWLADHKTTPTSPASIDRSSVDFEDGEMSFGIFKYAENEAAAIMLEDGLTDIDKLQKLHGALPAELFPSYVLEYISEDARLGDGAICFHSASEFGAKSKSYTDEEIRTIRRRKTQKHFLQQRIYTGASARRSPPP